MLNISHKVHNEYIGDTGFEWNKRAEFDPQTLGHSSRREKSWSQIVNVSNLCFQVNW